MRNIFEPTKGGSMAAQPRAAAKNQAERPLLLNQQPSLGAPTAQGAPAGDVPRRGGKGMGGASRRSLAKAQTANQQERALLSLQQQKPPNPPVV